MHMWTGRAAGRADLADDLADADLIADADVYLGHMPITGRKPAAVIDLDHLAVAAGPAGDADGAGGGGVDRFADLAAEVDAGVHCRLVNEWIHADAERRRLVDLASHRLAHRHCDEGVA